VGHFADFRGESISTEHYFSASSEKLLQ